MKPFRKQRLESSLVRELAELIHRRRTKDERFGFVSVTGVDLAPDLSRALIRVSLFGDDADQELTWRALRDNSNWLQSEASRNLRLRVTPHFEFVRDPSIAEGDRIYDMLEGGESPDA